MTLLLFIAFIGMAAGGLIAFRISVAELFSGLSSFFESGEKPLKSRIEASIRKKKVKGIKLLIKDTRQTLEATNKSAKFPIICLVSFALMVAGCFFAVAISNMLLIPVLGVGFSLIPFWYVLFTSTFYKKHLNNELETALSVITSSYLRTENIITAVEENITYLNPPIVEVFKSFLNQTRLINSNIRHGIEALKEKVDSDVFREWCDALIACQEDKNLKSTLLPIVSKLSDMRAVASDLEYLLYEPMKEFITMAILLVGNIPLLYFLNRSWFNTLMFHPAGKFILAVSGCALFISFAAVIRLSKPIEYKR